MPLVIRRRVSERSICSLMTQRRQVLIEFNETRRDYPKGRLIHELVAQHADRHPDRLAVVCEDQQLTYRELNARASQLGNYLRGLGVGPEAMVGICLERSVEMVVGILGILKAGGAWLPLDPHYPKERLAFMLHDAHAGVVVSDSQTATATAAGGNTLRPAGYGVAFGF